jgi:hypothetical protein
MDGEFVHTLALISQLLESLLKEWRAEPTNNKGWHYA